MQKGNEETPDHFHNGVRSGILSFSEYLLYQSHNLVGIAVCGFGISYLWSINVRRVTIGTKTEQIIYSTGAMLGGLTGVMMAKLIKNE